MDKKFIRRATQITSFNFTASDFQSLKYKKEIQYLFNFHFFPNFDLSRTLSAVNKDKLNALIADLKQESPELFPKLHAYNLKGIGPGEATLFFLVDNVHLGGGSSAGVDVIAGSKKYEVKAVKVSSDRVASDFKLGGTVKLNDIIQDIEELCKKLKIPGASPAGISGAIIDTLRAKAPVEFAKIESKYKERAEDYFGGHEVIFINNGSSKLGHIEAIKMVSGKDVTIERVTSGTIKPRVKL